MNVDGTYSTGAVDNRLSSSNRSLCIFSHLRVLQTPRHAHDNLHITTGAEVICVDCFPEIGKYYSSPEVKDRGSYFQTQKKKTILTYD